MAKGKSPAQSLEGMKHSWKEAMKVGDRLEEARWANSIGNLLKDRGEYVEALKWYRKDYEISLRLAKDAQSYVNLTTTCQCMGEMLLRLKEHEEALKFMMKHYDLATEASDLVEQQRSSTQLGRLFLDRANLNQDDNLGLPFSTCALPMAKEHLERALEIAQTLKDSPPKMHSRSFVVELVDAHNNVGLLREEEEDTNGALQHFQRALEICLQEELSDTAELSRVHHNLGRIYIAHRDWERAFRHTKKDIEICGKIGHKQGEAKGYMNLGEINTKQLQLDESLRCFRRALQLATELEDEDDLRKDLQGNIDTVVELQKVRSDFDKKRQELKRLERGVAAAEDSASKRVRLKQEFSKLKELLDLAGATQLNAWDEHLKLALRLKEVCDQLGDKEKEGDAAGELAESYENLRDFKKAKEWYETSYRICERLGHVEGQAVAKLNCGNTLDKMGLYDQAVEAYETAYEIAKSQEGLKYLTLQEQALNNLHSSFLIRLKRQDKAREVESRIQQLKLCQDSQLNKDSEEWPVMYPRSRSRRKLSRQASFLENPTEQQHGLHDVPDSESDESDAELSLNMNRLGHDESLTRRQLAPEPHQPPTVHNETPEAGTRTRPTRRLSRRSDDLGKTACLQESEEQQCMPGVADSEYYLFEAESAQKLGPKRSRAGIDEDQAVCMHQSSVLNENLFQSDIQSRKRRRLCRQTNALVQPTGQVEQQCDVADSESDHSDADVTRNMTGVKRCQLEHDKTTFRGHVETQCDEPRLSTHLEDCPGTHTPGRSNRRFHGPSSCLVKPCGQEIEERQSLHEVDLRESGQSAAQVVHATSLKKSSPGVSKLVNMERVEPQERSLHMGISTSVTIFDKYAAQCREMCCTLNPSVVDKLASPAGSYDELNVSGLNLDDADARPLLAALEAHEPLCALDMSHNRLGNDTMHNIQKLISKSSDRDPGLTLDLHSNRLGAGCLTQMCQCVVTLARLEVLDLSGNRLTDAVGRQLGSLLEQCSALATLQLRACGLTTRTIQRITAALKPTCSLSKLSIGGNNPIAGFAIAELLQKLATLNSKLWLAAEGVEALTVCLTSFSELDLGQVDLDEIGVQGITSFLSSSKSISILLLQETGIQNDGAPLITSFLKQNPCSLMKLDLSCCRIYGMPATSLCEQIINIQGLSWLDLSSNHLNSLAAEVIGRGLERAGCRLKRLNLRNCRFGMQGVLQVIRSVKGNLTLHDLDLAGNAENVLSSRSSTSSDSNIRVAKKGNHDEPVPAAGSFKELPTLQSRGYQVEIGDGLAKHTSVLSSAGEQAPDPSDGDKVAAPPVRTGEEFVGGKEPRIPDMPESPQHRVPSIILQSTTAAGSSEKMYGKVEPGPCDIADSEEDEKSEVETPLLGSQKRRLALRVRRRKSKESLLSGYCGSSSPLDLQLVEAVREARVLEVLDLSTNGLCQAAVDGLYEAWSYSRQARLPKKGADQVSGLVVFSVQGRLYPEPTCCGRHLGSA